MESGEDIDQQEPDRASALRRRLTASIASAFIPGTGQILLRQKISAAVYFALWLLLVLSYMVFRLPATYLGLIFLMLSTWCLHIASALHALVGNGHGRSISKWWFLVTAPLAFVAASVFCSVLMKLSGFRIFTVTSTSMTPTLVEGDKFVCSMQRDGSAARAIGKVVVFRHNGVVLVKRLIAAEGDTVSSADGHVSVNGKRLDEPYALINADMSSDLANFGPLIVSTGDVFLLGDSRGQSLDSRMTEFGTVKVGDVTGSALYIFDSKQDRTGRNLR